MLLLEKYYMAHRLLIFLIFAIVCVTEITNAQTVVACGGFVKGPDSLDFSRIEVRLFTTDGILKYQSFCAPHNGYFTVPVYNHGEYILKLLPPVGWTFTPSEVALKIDGKTDPCSKAEDINFAFAGFQVTGKVISTGSDTGPDDLHLELQSEKASEVKRTSTTSDGKYSFEGVYPGEYKLTAVHLAWRFKQNNIPIVVTKESVAAPVIEVTGFDITGSVVGDNSPISGVQFTLLASEKTNINVPECKTAVAKTQTPEGLQAVCNVQSDATGTFSFPPIPPGSYQLVPSFQNGRTSFSVLPNMYEVLVSTSSVNIKEPFVVSGFSISGRLSFPSGYPAQGVNVLLDGKIVATSSDDGIYIIQEMKTGNIKLTFSADHALFPPLSASISPESTILPDVLASKLSACGQIIGDAAGVDVVQVSARNTKTTAFEKLTVAIKKSRDFCFMLEPGDYSFAVELPVSIFIPQKLEISLKAGPQFGVSFEAFVASASGRVACLEKDCSEIFITLFERRDKNDLSPIAELKTLESGAFHFRSLHPGEYVLKASKPPFCFGSEDGVTFTVFDKDVTDLKVMHTGYKLTVTPSHPIRLGFKLKQEENSKKPEVFTDIEIRPPSQLSGSVCLPKPGKYEVSLEKSSGKEDDWACHFFRGSYPTEIDTNNMPKELTPIALLHLVTVGLQTNVEVPLEELYVGIRYIENTTLYNKITGKSDDPFADIPPNFIHLFEQEIAEYHKQQAMRQPITTPLKRRDRLYFGEDQVKKNANGTYSYNSAIFWYATQIALEPTHPRFIFKPKMIEFNLEQDKIECPAFAVFFSGVEAHVLRGYVTPPTAGVRVQLTNKKNAEEVHVVWTEQDGSYNLGPLDPEDQFDAEASIEGWEVQPIPNQPGNFTAKRLGSINIFVVDDTGVSLDGVLISISGPSHFRNNSMTSRDGTLNLGSLAGGQYYAQAFRKEYAFEPKNLLVSLASGEASQIKFVGTRVAYSCFGRVVSLNSEPEQGLYVVARSTDCENAPGEEGETDSQGYFRVLGLFPKCTYAISVRQHPQLERTVPAQATVRIQDGDVKNVNLWAVRAPMQQLLITVRLEGPAEFMNLLQVAFVNATSDSTLSSLPITCSLMAFPPLPFPAQSSSSYLLKVEPLPNFASNVYLLQTEAVQIELDESGFVHAAIKFNVKRRADLNDGESPIVALVQGRSVMSFVLALLSVAGIGGVFFVASADKNTKQQLLERARTFLSNPAEFFRSRTAPTNQQFRSNNSPVFRFNTSNRSAASHRGGARTVVADSTTNDAGLQQSSSSSDLSSSSVSDVPPANEVQKKRPGMRPRLQ